MQLGDSSSTHWALEQRRRLAYLVTETWMTMIFRHGFFHGDPHPANILVLAPDRIGLVDFGLRREADRRRHVAADAALHRRGGREHRGCCRSGSPISASAIRRSARRSSIAELREIYYRYYGASLQEIDPIQIIREAFALIYSMNLRLPTRFVLLDKAIATLGSVGVELYPDFNVFEVAKPYARALMVERFTPRGSRAAGAARGLEAQPDRRRAAVPDPRHARTGARRPDRGRLRPQGPRRVHGQARRAVQPARDRAGRHRRPDRLEPDRDLREDGPARPRPARDLGRRLRALGRARRVAALGRDPLRAVL